MFWLPLALGLGGGSMLGTWFGTQMLGSGGGGSSLLDVDLYGKTYEEGSTDMATGGNSGLGGLLGMGVGGIALLLMLMSFNTQRNQPTVVVVRDE